MAKSEPKVVISTVGITMSNTDNAKMIIATIEAFEGVIKLLKRCDTVEAASVIIKDSINKAKQEYADLTGTNYDEV